VKELIAGIVLLGGAIAIGRRRNGALAGETYRQLCQKCKGPMVDLMFQRVCRDACATESSEDDLPEYEEFDFPGYISISPDEVRELHVGDFGKSGYVFATRADAERWIEVNHYQGWSVCEVRGREAFRWQPSQGTVRGVILANRLYEIYSSKSGARGQGPRVLYAGKCRKPKP
jgi:hypothetical protein